MIYGDLDVHEIYDAPAEVRALARERVGLLAGREVVQAQGEQVNLHGTPWAELVGACAGQPLLDQISVGYCSVTLVAPDLAATAYHCLGWLSCEEMAIVRGYQFDSPGELHSLEVASDVRFCGEIFTPTLQPGQPPPEVGFIRLSTPFPAFETSLAVADLTVGAAAVALAHPAGIPLKFMNGAEVRDIELDQGMRVLVSNLDSFHGASGAPVFSERGELAGIIASGAPDFVPGPDGCWELSRASAAEPGEERAIVYSDARRATCLAPDDEACEDAQPPETDTGSAGCSIEPRRRSATSWSWLACFVAGWAVWRRCRWARSIRPT